MSDESEFFEELLRGPKGRPQHPDMMKLSDILLRHDGPTTDPTTMQTFSMDDRIAQEINPEVMSYASLMRANIFMGQLGIAPNVPLMLAISAAWLDAFLVGVEWQKAKANA